MGLNWSVRVGGSTDNLTTDGGTDALVFDLANGNYAYAIHDLPGWHQTNVSYTGTLVVNGAAVTEPTLTYYQVTYPVTFSESGLPASLTFNVTLNGTSQNLTTDGGTDALAFQVPNGSWAYSIADISGWHQSTLAYSGHVAVSGAGVAEKTLVYAAVTYSVSFSERGLPSGLNWQVTVGGVPKSLTTNGVTDTLTWTGVANGSYAYAIPDIPGWHQATLPYSGSISVSGSSVVEPTLYYAQVFFAVNFTESGLPAGLTWQVRVGSTTEGLTTDGGNDSLIFEDGNGTFSYVIYDVSGWHQTTLAYTGSVGVNGAPVTEATLLYVQVNYTVTFVESGLPTGTNWSVHLGGATNQSNGTSISFVDPNGTYAFALGLVPGYYSATESGTAHVTGPGLVVDVRFSQTTYTVTFTESGLPTHTSWSVTLSGVEHTTTGTATSFVQPNGTYPYTIGLVAGYVPATRSASVVVSNGSVSVPVPFTIVKYTVTFQETGLPTKKTPAWSLAVGGSLLMSHQTSIQFNVSNGTYTYLVAGPSGYEVSILAPEGTLTVNGASIVQPVQFLKGATTTMTFRESGLAKGSPWCVTVGWTACSSKTSLAFKNLTPATYDYAVGKITGFTIVVKLGKTYEGVNGSTVVPPAVTYTVYYTFPVKFTETGLPSGTAWTVSAGGFTNTSTTTSLTLDLVNGTYGFSIHKVTGYVASPPSGHFPVAGQGVTISITFTPKPTSPSSGGLVPGPAGAFLERLLAVLLFR